MQLKLRQYVIRSWKKEDAPVIAKYANNRGIWLNLRDGFPHPYSIDDANKFIANALAKEPETYFAIASHKEAIGSIGLTIGQDVHRYTAELAYWLAEPYWGQGIMTEAVQILAEYAFTAYDLNRIYAEPYTTNLASSRVLEKAGFLYEGRLKANVFKDGKILDQFIFAKIINT